MDKRMSCANCGSTDHHVADCTTYKQRIKSLGYTPDEDDISQMDDYEFYSGLIIKIGARCFFCNQIGLSSVLGSSEELESPKSQISTCGCAEH